MNFVSKDFFEIHLIAEIQAKNIGKKFLEYHFRDKNNMVHFSSNFAQKYWPLYIYKSKF